MIYQWDFSAVWRNADLLLSGLVNTIILSVASIAMGAMIGLLLVALRLSGRRPLAWPAIGIIEFMRNTPSLVHLFWIFYALPVLIGVSLSPFVAAWIAFSLNSGAFFAEVYRGGIVSIDRGQWEASRAVGMPLTTLMRRIILPQAFRRMIPPMVERSFEVVKTTALAATVAYGELLYEATIIVSKTYRPLEIYTAVAIIYFLLLFSASLVSRFIEARLKRRGG